MIKELLAKQKELMEKVPHEVRPDVLPKMVASANIINSLMVYLGACGHKPWRPKPLSAEEIRAAFAKLSDDYIFLQDIQTNKSIENIISATSRISYGSHNINKSNVRKLVSALGIIEESSEYLTSLSEEDGCQHQLEELVDILFFWLEQVLLSPFTEEQVIDEYYRKHAVNLQRYESLSKGDTSWDKRSEGKL